MNHATYELLSPVAIIGTFTVLVVLFTRTLTDYYLKKRMVQNGLDKEEIKALLKEKDQSKFAALKWGLIVFFGGLGLVVIEYIPYDDNSPLPFGILSIFLSLGFLIYYFMVKNENLSS